MCRSGKADLSLKILVADDHKIVREGLCSLIEKEPGMEVVGEAENGQRALELVRELLPDVVVMDVAMADLNGIEATRQVIAQAPDTKVVALSMHSDRRFVAEMLRAGASGYLLKDCAFEELARAIRTVAEDQPYLNDSMARLIIKEYVEKLSANDSSAYSSLTSRERQVLQLLSEGNTTKEIACRLNISVKTVETHRRKMMDKLDIHSIAELTKYAVREGVTSP